MARRRRRRRQRTYLPWVKAALLLASPVVLLNLSVSWFGSSWVFPLSPFFLEEKARALGAYALHRPACLFDGHGELGPLIAAAERKHGLPRGLLAAVIAVESEGRPHRISAAGAMGPAQLMPGTAALLGVKDPFEPPEAIDGSARYLAQHLRRFGKLPLAVAAYNAGPGAVRGAVPHNGETEHYVRKVMKAYRRSAVRAAAPAPRAAGGTPRR